MTEMCVRNIEGPGYHIGVTQHRGPTSPSLQFSFTLNHPPLAQIPAHSWELCMNMLECCKQFYLYKNFYFCRRIWRNKPSASQKWNL